MSLRLLAAFAVIGLPVVAHAAPKADCDFIEISATNEKTGSIEPELKPLEKKLKNPPFSSWNTFHRLSRTPKTLEQLKPETITLKIGKVTALLDSTSSSQVRLALTVVDGSGKVTVNNTKTTISAGDWVVFGRSEANNAGHLLAITCK